MQLAASRIIAACRIIAMNIQVQVAISFRNIQVQVAISFKNIHSSTRTYMIMQFLH